MSTLSHSNGAIWHYTQEALSCDYPFVRDRLSCWIDCAVPLLTAVSVVVEVKNATGDGGTRVGMCAVDVASVHLIAGEFDDDDLSSKLRTHLAGETAESTTMW